MWFYGNKFWFFHLFPFSGFTPKQSSAFPLSEKSQFLACDVPSCQPANALARPRLMCLCLLCGGDWNSLCEMIFEVIKESRSAELTVLMESRTLSSSPNSQTGLLTAAGGAQRHSKCREGCALWFNLQRLCLLSWLFFIRDTEKNGNAVNTELARHVWWLLTIFCDLSIHSWQSYTLVLTQSSLKTVELFPLFISKS